MKKSTYKVFTFIVVILCLLTLAIAWTSNWFVNWNMADWSKKWSDLFGITTEPPVNPDKPTEPDKPAEPLQPIENEVVAIDSLGNNIYANQPIAMQSFAYTCSNESENKKVTLHATVLPDDATDKTLIWDAIWKTDANGTTKTKNVNNYVKLTPSSDSLSCDVEYVQDFDVPIILKVNSKFAQSISDECRIDCLQKLTDFKFIIAKQKYYPSTNMYGIWELSDSIGWNMNEMEDNGGGPAITDFHSGLGFEFNTSLYTIKNSNINLDNMTFDLTISLTDEFKTLLSQNGIQSGVSFKNVSVSYDGEIESIIPGDHIFIGDKTYIFDHLITRYEFDSLFEKNFNKSKLRNIIINNPNVKELHLSIITKSSPQQYINLGDINLNPDMFCTPVSNVKLSQSNVVI